MINPVTGEIAFGNGLRILPHCAVSSLSTALQKPVNVRSQKLSLGDWKRYVLGTHPSEHGSFQVEALSADDDCIHVVLLSHQHPFYEAGTPDDAERRAFHEGVINSDLAGQREFTWGEVICRLEMSGKRDWLVIAYNRQPRVPFTEKTVLLRLCAHERPADDNP
ncbi:MAG TPA: hypothetical protein VHI52_16635 [Verrucomicrobiae bacterium]|nr:hypothetical protein [Verrucomicrobiae bacterium]